MKRAISSVRCACLISLSLTFLLFTAPAWADKKKSSVDAPSAKVGQAKKDDKSLSERDESKRDDKKGSTVKKNAAKKAGTAAAAGVATKKVTSEIKK
jgi:hypothetical protein